MVKWIMLLLALPALAGCANQVSTTGSLDTVSPFDGFTWTEPQRLGPDAAAFADAPPHYVQQLTPLTAVTPVGYDLITMSPPVAVDDAGALYTITLDEVLKSTDHGASWNVSMRFRTMADETLQDRWETTDHALWMDQASQTLYASFMGIGGCQVLYATVDGGQSWEARGPNDWITSCGDTRDIGAYTHSQFMLTAPHAGPLDALPRFAPHTFYWCEQVFYYTGPKCSTSWDGGATFVHEALIAPADENGCHAATFGKPAARADGVVAMALGPRQRAINLDYYTGGAVLACALQPEVSFSTDGGLSWQVAKAPEGLVQAGAYPSLAFSPDGTAYLAYRDGASKVQVLRSSDLFQSWQGPFTVSLPDHLLGAHPAVTVGDDGHVAVSYLGSSSPQHMGDEVGEIPAVPENADTGTIWHLYTATSRDAGADEPTWYVQQLTPAEDPIHMGCILDWTDFIFGSFGYACYNMGQYTDFVTGADGRAYASLIDGCTPRNGCTADVEGAYAYRDRQVTVAVLDSGTGLTGDVLPSFGLEHPAPKRDDHEVYTEEVE